jgi:hypothetical protein
VWAFLGVEVCLLLSLRKRYNNVSAQQERALKQADASLKIAFPIAKSRP